jgi:CHAT domain-containing protein/predicted negative regulator of RcsB-dependent stress response/exonuclease VII small subunit
MSQATGKAIRELRGDFLACSNPAKAARWAWTPRPRHLFPEIVLALSVLSCARHPGLNLQELYDHAAHLEQRGDLHEALATAERGLATSRRRKDAIWQAQFQLLKVEILLTSGDTPAAQPLLEPGPTGLSPASELSARLVKDRGWAKASVSDFGEALKLLDQAALISKAGGFWSIQAETHLLRGKVLVQQGNLSEAEAAFRAGLKLASDHNDNYLEALALGDMGYVRTNAARYDEAISWFNRALAVFERLQLNLYTARTLNNLGYCYFQLGDPEKARRLYEKAEQSTARTAKLNDLHFSLGSIGNWYFEQHDYKQALAYYERALEIARRIDDQFWVANWLYNLSATTIELGDLVRAEGYNRQALALQARLGSSLEKLWPQINVARIAEARHEPAKAEETYRSVIQSAENLRTDIDPGLVLEARGRLANLLAKTHRDREADAQFRAALALINTTRSLLTEDEYRISYFSSLMRFYQDYVDFLMARHRETEALKLAESSRARVLVEKLGGGGTGRLPAAGHDYRELARKSRTIFLSYWLGPRRSYLWTVTGKQIAAFELPPQAEIASLVEVYQTRIESLRDPLREGSSVGQRLYETLVKPAISLIPAGSVVAVVPDGSLHSLNFETIPVEGSRPHYWIEDLAFSVVPSLDLLYRRADAPANRSPSALLIGDPLPPEEAGVPKLLHAGTEISQIRQQFKHAVVRTGPDAEPQAYPESRPDQFSVIHFAAHAEANRDDPLDSAIILSRGGDAYKLYARDIVGVPIRANLVTISACRSAGARAYAGEGLVGFAWAFLKAGASNVVAGLWEVDDRSTTDLMNRMYAEMRSGKNPAEALRIAKLALSHSEGPERKPYYWGPFQVITDSLSH